MKSHCLPQEVISPKHWPLSQAAERAWTGSHHYACNTHIHHSEGSSRGRNLPPLTPLLDPGELPLHFSTFCHCFSVLCWATGLNSRDHWAWASHRNTQAANARALGAQYGDQETGPPGKTCQELGISQSFKGPWDLAQMGSVEKSLRNAPISLPPVVPDWANWKIPQLFAEGGPPS